MNELIPLNDGPNGEQVVSARALHQFLEVGSDFTTWCNRMFEYGFIESIDFTPILGKSLGGRPSIDYALTLDCAKEISMLQRTEKGKQARRYFIACEKRLRVGYMVPTSFKEALQLAVEQQERIEQQQQQIDEAKPKVEFYEAVTGSADTKDLSEVAKVINWPNVGRNKLFAFLREQKVLRDNNQPYQTHVDLGWFRLIESKWQKPNGDVHINMKTVVFQKGIEGIRKLMLKHLSE